ncbi:MAG: AAA family ATPase [Pirellulaceae bacterium]
MYEAYWQLETKPFENTSDARFYFPGEAHQGAMLKLRYAIENRRGIALLAGASGLGKTLLVQALAKQLDDCHRPLVHLVFPDMPPAELLAYLCDELSGTRSRTAPTIAQSVRGIELALSDAAEQGRHPIIVIDEAHLLRDSAALDTIRLLTNFERNGKPAMMLLLVGQPSLLPALDRMPDLDERLGVKSLLRPFTCDETKGYVNHRLTAAGAARTIFREDALDAVHRFSHGNARRINRLCDLALLIGYAEEQPTLGAAQIEAVAEELVAVAPE